MKRLKKEEQKRVGPTEDLPGLTVTHASLLVDGSDGPFRELINNLLLMAKQLQGLRSELAEQLGVTEPQYRVFMSVAQLQGENGVCVGAVAAALRVTGAFVTAEAGKLVSKGLIQKREDSADRRSVLLSLSEIGRQTHLDFATRPQAVNNELFHDITKEEFQSLREIVRRLVGNGDRAALLARALATNEFDSPFLRRLSGLPIAPAHRKATAREIQTRNF